jgi:hypothetical protein
VLEETETVVVRDVMLELLTTLEMEWEVQWELINEFQREEEFFDLKKIAEWMAEKRTSLQNH